MSNHVKAVKPITGIRVRGWHVESPEGQWRQEREALLQERTTAVAAARQEGVETGRKAAEAAHAQELAKVRHFQQQVLQKLVEQEQRLMDEVEAALPELILSGMQQVMYQWRPDAAQVEAVVRELLPTQEASQGGLRLYLHSGDKTLLERLREEFADEYPDLEIIEDVQLRPGECYIQGRFGNTDGRFASKLAEMRKVLS